MTTFSDGFNPETALKVAVDKIEHLTPLRLERLRDYLEELNRWPEYRAWLLSQTGLPDRTRERITNG